METLTLDGSVIRGMVQGKPILCTFLTSPPGLRLPAGSFMLRAPYNNPVYGTVMSVEPYSDTAALSALGEAQGGPDPAAVKFRAASDPVGGKATPGLDPAGVKIAPGPDPAALKVNPGAFTRAPAGVKDRPGAYDMTPPAIKADVAALKDAPAIKFDAPAIKFDSPSAIKEANVGPYTTAPVTIADRAIAGNCLVVTAGFADLVEAVGRAGVIRLVVS
jgi:hypothetical protein